MPEVLPHGAIIGSVSIVGCEQDVDSPWALAGRWHWILSNAIEYEPVPSIGKLGALHGKDAFRPANCYFDLIGDSAGGKRPAEALLH